MLSEEIAELLRYKGHIDQRAEASLRMNGGEYSSWALEALALLLREALERETKQGQPPTIRKGIEQ